ncbi:MAG: hypothetical protein MHPSP_000351 [Paramarteilia canceri]
MSESETVSLTNLSSTDDTLQLEEQNIEQLRKIFCKITDQIRIMETEKIIFNKALDGYREKMEKNINKSSKTMINSQRISNHSGFAGQYNQSEISSVHRKIAPKKRSTNASRSASISRRLIGGRLKLNYEQKIDFVSNQNNIVEKEVKDLESTLENLKTNLEASIDLYKIVMGKNRSKIDQMNDLGDKSLSNEFFHMLKSQHKDSLSHLSKLKRKNTIFQAKISQIASQLKQRKSMGDTVQWVDFERLQIENKKKTTFLNQTNKELVKNKLELNSERRKLQGTNKVLNSFEKEIYKISSKSKKRREQLRILDLERKRMVGEVQKIKEKVENLKTKSENFTAPKISDYIAIVEENSKLKNRMRSIVRKNFTNNS